MTIAVDDQYLDFSIELIVLTRKVCSSSRVGVTRVAVLVGRRLDVAHGRQRGAAGAVKRVGEVRHVVLVVGLVGVADLGERARREVGRVRGRRVVLERVVVRNVVGGRGAADVRVRGAADRQGVGRARCVGGAGGREAALEPAPGDVRVVQQVADVLAGHRGQGAVGGVVAVGAVVVVRVLVAVQRAKAGGRVHVHDGAGGRLRARVGRRPRRERAPSPRWCYPRSR